MTKQSKKIKTDVAPVLPYAELFRDGAGGYRWRVKAANHEIVASSESYTTKPDAVRGYGDVLDIFKAINKLRKLSDGDILMTDLTEDQIHSGTVVESVDAS
jgi:uncharacterized protein YegP (UPF0339 family)